MGLALKLQELDEETFCRTPAPTKECSACDPDMPGHVLQGFCPRCKGTGRESLSFQSTFTELSESRREALANPEGKKRWGSFKGDLEYSADGDDDIQDLEY